MIILSPRLLHAQKYEQPRTVLRDLCFELYNLADHINHLRHEMNLHMTRKLFNMILEYTTCARLDILVKR